MISVVSIVGQFLMTIAAVALVCIGGTILTMKRPAAGLALILLLAATVVFGQPVIKGTIGPGGYRPPGRGYLGYVAPPRTTGRSQAPESISRVGWWRRRGRQRFLLSLR